MDSYVTPEEIAQRLRIEIGDVMTLIEQGKLRAIRIGDNIRVRETELEKLDVTCAAGPTTDSSPSEPATVPDGSRWCFTRTKRAKFRVAGSIASAMGVEIWPGRMQYPIKFPKHFLDATLAHFSKGDIPVGGKFDDPGRGSLGEFIQRELKIKMNPAVYLAALLIDEGYAEPAQRGYIRFRSSRRPHGGRR